MTGGWNRHPLQALAQGFISSAAATPLSSVYIIKIIHAVIKIDSRHGINARVAGHWPGCRSEVYGDGDRPSYGLSLRQRGSNPQ